MKINRKQMGAANNSARAMETGGYPKTGAIPKSRKCRGNFLSVLIAGILLPICSFITSCDKNGDAATDNNKLTIMSNAKDPRLFNYTTEDGYSLIAYGERGDDGAPATVDYAYLTNGKTGETLGVYYDENARISRLASGNCMIDLQWETATYANVKIHFTDNSEEIFSYLGRGSNAPYSAKASTSASSMRREINKSPLIVQSLDLDSRQATIRSGNTGKETFAVTLHYKGVSPPFDHYPDPVDKVIVNIRDNVTNELIDTYELKYVKGNDYPYYAGTYPLCPTSVVEDLQKASKKIADWFKPSVIDMEDELYKLSKRLGELQLEQNDLLSRMEILTKEWKECNNKIDGVKKKIATKEAEYEDRLAEQQGKTVKVSASAYSFGKKYTTNSIAVNCENSASIPSFKIELNYEPYIFNVSLDPANPSSNSGGGIYRVWFSVGNIIAGTTLTVHVKGTDGYESSASKYFSSYQEADRYYYTIPVALESGIRDEITVTASWGVFNHVTKNVRVVFR